MPESEKKPTVCLKLTKTSVHGNTNGSVASKLSFHGVDELEAIELTATAFTEAVRKVLPETDEKQVKDFFFDVIKVSKSSNPEKGMIVKTWKRPADDEKLNIGLAVRRNRPLRDTAGVLMDCFYTFMSIMKLDLTSKQIDDVENVIRSKFSTLVNKHVSHVSIYFKPASVGSSVLRNNAGLDVVKNALREFYGDDESCDKAIKTLAGPEFYFGIKLNTLENESLMDKIRHKKTSQEWDPKTTAPGRIACWTVCEYLNIIALSYELKTEPQREPIEV